MNCTILEMDENYIVNEPTTPLAQIPNFLLDEWVNAYQFYTMSKNLETGLNTYCILEKDALVSQSCGE